jgi:hypothetical protein
VSRITSLPRETSGVILTSLLVAWSLLAASCGEREILPLRGLPSELPRPPAEYAFDSEEAGRGEVLLRSRSRLSTDEGAEELLDFYAEHMPAYGWTLIDNAPFETRAGVKSGWSYWQQAGTSASLLVILGEGPADADPSSKMGSGILLLIAECPPAPKDACAPTPNVPPDA